MTREELLNMGLHATIILPCKSHDVIVRRVFGGWIYTESAWCNETDNMTSAAMCFVPEEINVYTKEA